MLASLESPVVLLTTANDTGAVYGVPLWLYFIVLVYIIAGFYSWNKDKDTKRKHKRQDGSGPGR